MFYLKALEKYPLKNMLAVSVLINCGFLEYNQNATAVPIMQLFCDQNNYP